MTLDYLSDSLRVALVFAIIYFVAALTTGVWKWQSMLRAEDGQAHAYVDIAHHAALHYGPFIVLAGALATLWPYAEWFPAWPMVAVMGATMVASLARYISLGIRGEISNQLHRPTAAAKSGLFFFFFGSVLPGLTIAFGAGAAFWHR